jgi:hypothetical protein
VNRDADSDFDWDADAASDVARRQDNRDDDEVSAGTSTDTDGDALPPQTIRRRMSCGAILLVAFFFVGFPALWTAVAPVSYVRLERQGDHVRASSKTCLLFFIPYRHQSVDRVVGVNDRFRAGEVRRRRSHEIGMQTEDEAFMILHGEAEDDFLEVSVSPASIQSRVQLTEQFLNDPASLELRLFCVSNWKFAVFAGGMISLLTVLWALGMLLMLVRWFLRLAGLSSESG